MKIRFPPISIRKASGSPRTQWSILRGGKWAGGPLNGVTPKTRSWTAGRTRVFAPFTRTVVPALALRVLFAGTPADWASRTLVGDAISFAPVARRIGGTS